MNVNSKIAERLREARRLVLELATVLREIEAYATAEIESAIPRFVGGEEVYEEIAFAAAAYDVANTALMALRDIAPLLSLGAVESLARDRRIVADILRNMAEKKRNTMIARLAEALA